MPGKFAPNLQQIITDAGGPGNAYYQYYYEPDGAFSTEKTVYKDADLSTAWTQPITVGADGRPVGADIFLNGDYDRRTYDSDDALIRSEQNIGDTWSAVGTDLSENLVSNHSFETAGTGGEAFENWTETDPGSTITRDTTDPYHGAACALWTSASSSNDDYLTSSLFEVSPGKDVQVDFYLKCSNANANPTVRVVWYTAAQALISNSLVYSGSDGLTPTSYTLIRGVTVTPPATARYALILPRGNVAATAYTTRMDGFSVRQVDRSTFGVVTRIPVGLELSRDSGDTSHDINVTAGAVLDSTGAKEIVLTSEITKRIDAGFSNGDDAGGLASGSSLSANGYVNVFVGLKSATSLVDVFFDTGSYDSPTPPTGFDYYRYLGMWPLDSSSNLENGVMKGGRFTKYADPAAEISSTVAYNTSEQTATINAPPYSRIDYAARLEMVSGQASDVVLQIKPADSSWTNSNIGQGMEVTDIIDELHFRGEVALDVDSQLKWDATIDGHTGNMTLNLYCLGWYDVLRDNP